MLAIVEATDVDLTIQDRFYNASTRRWWVDAREPVGRAVFYHGPKALVWAVGLAGIGLVAGPARWRNRWALPRRGLGVAILSLATIPLLAGLGKRTIGLHCPSDLTRYGGEAAYQKLFSARPPVAASATKGGCFPAGHASGGFALWGFIALRNHTRWRRLVIMSGMTIGWWMGGYQMLKGAHFLSHTLATMLLSWFVVLVWRQVLGAWPLNPVPETPAAPRTHEPK